MTLSSQPYGCIECDWERLRKWAIDNNLIAEYDGPKVMVDRIMLLVDRMAERIKTAERNLQ